MTSVERETLLGIIKGQKAVSETDMRTLSDLKWFYKTPHHARAHERDIFLIIGGRGSGKTALFEVMTRPDSAIKQLYPQAYPSSAQFIKGFDTKDQEFPTEQVIKDLVDTQNMDSIGKFWQGLLLYVLWRHFQKNDVLMGKISAELGDEALTKMSNASQSLFWMKELASSVISNALDSFDRAITQQGMTVYVPYDYLDRIFLQDYSVAIKFASSLLSFWLNRAGRWKSIRPKIFLRKDIYDRSRNFPDASKLSGYLVELKWDDVQLYSMWIKRFINADEGAYKYCNAVNGLIEPMQDTMLGYLTVNDKDAQKEFIKRLVGEYMGTNKKKGLTYPWIVDKVSDAQGVALPRSFIKIFAQAAEWMLADNSHFTLLEAERMLLPKAFSNALDHVSTERIDELQEEYGSWISDLQQALKGMMVPAYRSEIQVRISKYDSLKHEGDHDKMLGQLSAIGILEERIDERISMPWIYRRGFDVKSRGGVGR